MKSGAPLVVPRYTDIADWFECEEIVPRIHRIRERYYREDYRCNIYVVKGMTRDLIIDAGLGLASLREFTRPLTAAPLLVLSHSHYDHIGSAFEFPQRAIHAAEAPLISAPTRKNTYADLLLATEDFTRLPWPGYSAESWQPVAAPPTQLLREGHLLDLGDRAFEVLSTPGHSWGSICLWDARNRVLLSADTVYPGELFDHLPCSDIPAYLQTMDRLRVLPVEIALPGHGDVLTGVDFRRIAVRYIAGRAAAAVPVKP
jgi:glyoxylase-like metal-dependent hydrolase (beta-lactamase superfamily II)